MSEILLVNPRRRRRTTKRRVTKRRPARRRAVARRRNPVAKRATRRRVSRRRSNPRVTAPSIQTQVMTASTGALGALGLDVILAYIPLPAAITGGIIGKVAKGAGAIALGIVANKFLGVSAANANRMAEGALTVQLHGIGKELLAQFAPGVAMSAYLNDGAGSLGYYGSGWNPSVDDPDALNAYLPDISSEDAIGMQQDGLGAYADAGYGYDQFYGG